MSSVCSRNFLAGDIVAIECRVQSNYLIGDGELGVVSLSGGKTTIYVREDSITMIRPVLQKGDQVLHGGMSYNVVAQDTETSQTWISRDNGATNEIVPSADLTRLVYADAEDQERLAVRGTE